jgi:hypothetical protein
MHVMIRWKRRIVSELEIRAMIGLVLVCGGGGERW